MEPRELKSFKIVVFCLAFSISSFIRVDGQVNVTFITHNSPSQDQIVVHLDNIIDPTTDLTGWTVEYNLMSQPLVSVFGDADSIVLNIAAAVLLGDIVTVSYSGGGAITGPSGDLNDFTDVPSENTNMPSCNMFTGIQSLSVNSLSGLCSPVSIDLILQYEIYPHIRNSINFNVADLMFEVHWGDVVNTVNQYGVTETVVGSGFFEANPSFVYPPDGNCSKDITVFPVYVGGSPFQCPGEPQEMHQPVASYGLDNEGSGTLAMIPDKTLDHCLGEDIDLLFSDATDFNCDPADEPGLPNIGERHVQFIYGTTNTPGRMIPNVYVNGVQVTDATGNLISTPYDGPVVLYDSANAPFPNLVSYSITHTGDTMNDLPGDHFEVTLNNWGPCNPYDGGFGTPITTYEVITLNDVPPQPIASDQTFCPGSVGDLIATDNTGGTLNWYDDAGLTNLVAIGPAFDHGQTTPGIYDYWVTEVNGSGCEGPAKHVQLIIDQPPEITIQPVDREVCESGMAYFKVDPGGTTFPFYQWEVNDGGGFNQIVSGPYNGQTTDSLSVVLASSAMNGYLYRVVVSGSCAPPVTSTPAVLTVLETPEILVQPVDVTECEGLVINFSADAGVTSNPVFEWQYNDGGGWNPVVADANYSGENTNTLLISGLPLFYSLYQYRVVVDNTCGPPVMSDAVTLTVEENPVITAHPADTAICETEGLFFTATATGPSLIYQWEVSDDGGTSWSDLSDGAIYSGTNTNNLNLTNTPITASGYKYRLEILTGMGCRAITDEATLIVDIAPVVAVHPVDVTTCENMTASFNVDPGTTTNPRFQWRYFDGSSWKDVPEQDPYYGTKTDSFTIINTPLSHDGFRFHVNVYNSCGPGWTSDEALLSVGGWPIMVTEPFNIKTKKPGIIQLVAGSSGAPHDKLWQRSADDGNTWATLTDGSKYSGTNTDTLTLINPSPSDGIWFRMKLSTVNGCDVFSNPVQVGIDFHYQVEDMTIHLTGMAPEYQYQWSFGDGEFSNAVAPSYKYAVPGLYEVCLTGFDNVNDISEVVCKPVLIGTVDCQAQYDYSISGDDSLTVIFTDRSTGAVNSWYWTFGDGLVSEKKDLAHIFSFPGLYKVCLYTLDTITGCQSNICRQIKVGKEPMIAEFIHFTNDTNTTVVFSSQSTGDITHWYWTFGDGESYVGKETSHTYKNPGLYEVCLFANNSVTGEFAESCKKIRVGETLCNIKAGFITFISNKNLRVAFNERSTGNIKNWFWNFGDGISSTLRNPVHIYDKNGLYRVSLSVRDSLGKCYDLYSELIQVGDIACIADFEYSVDPTTKTVTFMNRSSKNSEFSYWSFGDGEYSDEMDPEHTYPEVGVYGVTLTIVDSTGQCMDSRFEKVQIGSIECQADFTWYVDSAGNKAFFNPHLLGDPNQVVWTFGDGSSSTRLKSVHQYTTGGFYKVGLNAFNDKNGCMDYQEKIILISTRGADCLADFIYSSDMTAREVSFTEKSTGNIDKYIWDFGDRTVIEAKNPVHSYNQGGFYLVCLTVLNEFGITNTTCKYIQVSAESSKNCLADYFFSIDSAGKNVSFVDASFGKPDEWTWDFGDDQTSDLEEPGHVYSKTGIYRVGLRISNSLTGCVSKVLKLVDAGAGNTGLFASFIYEIDSINLKADSYPVDFIGVSLGSSKKFKWSFGDGTVDSTSLRPTHTYTSPGIYEVCFTVIDPLTNNSSTSCDSLYVGVSEPSSVTGMNGYPGLSVYPNPFRDVTVVKYYLPEQTFADLSVYDLLGRKIRALRRDDHNSGMHELLLERDNMQAGIYYIVLTTARERAALKIIIE